MNYNQSQRGFNLVELVVYVAIVAIVLLAFSTFAIRLARSHVKAEIVGEVGYNAALIETRINDAMRHAELINTGASVFGSDPGTLSLDMADAAVDPTVFSLDADDGTFQVSVDGGAAAPITTEGVLITNLTFTDLTSDEDVGVVLVEYTVQANNPSSDPLFSYEESFQTTARIPLDLQ